MKYSFRAKLFETQTLLAEANEERWSGVLADLLARYDQSPSGARKSLLSLYGRNDSFSDFALPAGDGAGSETNRRFDRLRAELHRACVDEETASQGQATDEAVDLRQLAIEVAIVAAPLFLLEIASPTSVGVFAGFLDYVAAGIRALAGAVALCASYRTIRKLRGGERPEGSGQYVAMGFGTMVAFFAVVDLCLVIWSRLGLGIPAFESLNLAITYAGLALTAAAMAYGARQASVEPPWRHALLAGAILDGTWLLPAGLFAVQWMVRIVLGPVDVFDALVFLGSGLASFVLGLSGLGWLAYAIGIYARERSDGERYPWMHYAPLVMWSLSLLALAIVGLGYVLSV